MIYLVAVESYYKMPSIKDLKSQDFIELQDKLYQILEIVSRKEDILLEASYPLKEIKSIIDNIAETKIGEIARNSVQRARHGRTRRDVIISYQDKLKKALDYNDPTYTCCNNCKEPIATNSLLAHKSTAKCRHNYNRILAGKQMKRSNGELIKRAIPVIGDLVRFIRDHKYCKYQIPSYYWKYDRQRMNEYSDEWFKVQENIYEFKFGPRKVLWSGRIEA